MKVRVVDGRFVYCGKVETSEPVVDLETGVTWVTAEWFRPHAKKGLTRYTYRMRLQVDATLELFVQLKWKELERLDRAGVLTDTLD